MNEQFKVDDICIFQHCKYFTEYEGTECVVTGPLEISHAWNDPIVCHRYLVRAALDGKEFQAYPHQLRRKPPKQSGKEWAKGKVREITQDSVHVAGGSKHLIPEEANA